MVDGGVDGETSPISISRDIPNHVISKVRDEEVERVPIDGASEKQVC